MALNFYPIFDVKYKSIKKLKSKSLILLNNFYLKINYNKKIINLYKLYF